MLLPKNPVRSAARALRVLASPTRPVLAQMVVTRRCNLACGYCTEYDAVSAPVPTETLLRQVDVLAQMGTLTVTLTGGEPLLHPDLDVIIRRVVERGMVCTAITNAYPLTVKWIERLNGSGLTLMQVSIDNVESNDKSKKSWSKLKPRLQLMRDKATFAINVNAVLGSCAPEQTRQVVREAKEMGFFMTVGLMHDEHGQIDPGLAGDQLRALYEEMQDNSRKSLLHRAGEGWEGSMIQHGVAPWKCRAGAKYLYVDEFGKVSYCSQRRGEPGIALLEYSKADALAAFHTPKGCEDKCTLGCVRRASAFDQWRGQKGTHPSVAVRST